MWSNERFKAIAVVGRGAMGIVYRVHDAETDSEVALKSLETLAPSAVYDLKQEFRILAGIAHPNLVDLYELIVSDADCFFTMEFIDGRNFVDFVRTSAALTNGPPEVDGLELDRLADATAQVIGALAAVHGAGKLHRDIKPSNLLVDRSGRVVVLDFGLATVLRGAGDPDRGFSGTLAYAAPEQIWGGPRDPAADWYSLGVVLYETLTGRLPFDGPPDRVMVAKAHSRPAAARTLCPSVPAALDDVISALLDPDPTARPSPADLLAQLRTYRAPHGAERAWVAAAPVAPRDDRAFVGRTGELAQLRAARTRLRDGHASVVHVLGPSGIGKSELVRRFCAELEADAATILLGGRCHLQESVPYNALDTVVDGLSRLLMTFSDRDVAALVPHHAAALVRIFPVLARVRALDADLGGVDVAEPQEIRRRGFAALRELVGNLGTRGDLVVWIDDVQWGDPDSTLLLRELLRPPDPPRLLLILSYRDDEDLPLIEAIDADADEPGGVARHRLRLEPLPADTSRELALRLFANTPLRGLRVETILDEAAGSPFLIGELARYAASAVAEETTATISAARLSDAVAERVRRLSPTAQRILEVVAVAGRPLDRSIVLAAAGVGERARPIVARLQEASLVRTTTPNRRAAIEPYHDRLAGALLDRLGPDRLRLRHGEIADALEIEPAADPEALYRHHLGAGREARAASWAERAADGAAATLAFRRAADLYREALRLGADDPEGRLRIRLAEALANAGMSREAAASFETAAAACGASDGDDERAIALRCRAADQYLRGGALEQGSALLHDALRAVGVDSPASPAAALRASIGRRLRLLWRGVDFTPRPPEAISARTRLRLDTLYAGAAGLSLLEPITSDAMSLQVLREALEAGDRPLVNRALGMEVARLASLGSGRYLERKRAVWLVALEQSTRASGTPFDEAAYHRAVGMAAYFAARWRTALENCDRACAIWREQCRGASWEIVTVGSFALTALVHLGELQLLAERLPDMLADADGRGDVYAGTCLRMGWPNIHWLAQDRPDEALAIADDAIRAWPADRFLVPHYLHLVATTQADLYRGDVWRAWHRLCVAWPKLKAAYILSVASTRVELYHLRARVALGAAGTDRIRPADGSPPDSEWPRTRLIRQACADAKYINRHSIVTASPFSDSIAAGATEDLDQAVRLYDHAAEGFRRVGMDLYCAAAEFQAGQLRGRPKAAGDIPGLLGSHPVESVHALAAMLCPRA